jgi:hypothetical protein
MTSSQPFGLYSPKGYSRLATLLLDSAVPRFTAIEAFIMELASYLGSRTIPPENLGRNSAYNITRLPQVSNHSKYIYRHPTLSVTEFTCGCLGRPAAENLYSCISFFNQAD